MGKKIFLNRIVELRKESGLSQSELGRAIGVTRDCINTIERGQSFNPEHAILLADFFDVSLDYLYGRTDDRRNPCIQKSA